MEKYQWLSKQMEAADENAFAFRISCERFSTGGRTSFPCHWHSEAEFIYVEEGELEYRTGGALYRLSAGNGAFTGPNIPHMTENAGSGDCVYRCFYLDPAVLCGGRDTAVYRKYVATVLWPVPVSCCLDRALPVWNSLLSLLLEAESLYHTGEDGYELLVTGKLCALWKLLYTGLRQTKQPSTCCQKGGPATGVVSDISRLKTALAFIRSHYREDIALKDIADACPANKTECCHLFKRFLGRSPFSYLLYYRIQASLPLLEKEELSMAEIAVRLGFHGNSYFAEVFKKIMGRSPSDYRKTHRLTPYDRQ